MSDKTIVDEIIPTVVKTLIGEYNKILDEQVFSRVEYIDTLQIMDIISSFCAEIIKQNSIINDHVYASKTRLRLLSEILAENTTNLCNVYANDLLDNEDMK